MIPSSYIRTCEISGLQQLFEYGYFHADPHPGNMFALKGGSLDYGHLAYVDFGMMDTITNSDRLTLIKACLLYTSPSPRDLSTSRMPSSA